jgi:hypothetical protein
LPPDVPNRREQGGCGPRFRGGVQRRDPSTSIAAGPFAGRRLADLIALDRDALLGSTADRDGRFPVLIKLLDVNAPVGAGASTGGLRRSLARGTAQDPYLGGARG